MSSFHENSAVLLDLAIRKKITGIVSFENPDVLDRIPKGAVLVILPEDEEELYAENYSVLEENKRKGIPVFVVTMKMPRPQISNIEIIAA